MTGLITVIICLSYSDLVVGVVAHPGCDAQKPGGGSLPCSTANAKSLNLCNNSNVGYDCYHFSTTLLGLSYIN